MQEISGAPEKTFEKTPAFRRYMILKRILDFIMASVATVFAAIPMGIIALAVRLDSGGEAFFRQKRIGRDMKPFYCLKFRSMRKEAPSYCATKELHGAEDYITRVGRILRKTSLDELPQLFNILKGDMSLIGPRPLIPEEEEIHELRRQYNVYRVRPGLTGLAQINGRDRLTCEEKARLDKEYVDHCGVAADLAILFKTVRKVLGMSDVIEGGDQ